METRPRSALAFVAAALLTASPLSAATLHVPGDSPTIQGAIQLAQPGDSVVVAAGTYSENLTMRSGILIRGTSGAAATIVDGRYLGPVILCSQAQDFTIEDLTIRRGNMSGYPGGAGISMNYSSGIFSRCVIADNLAGRDGGGIAVVDSRATIQHCLFENNSAATGAFLDGGAIFGYRSVLVVEDSRLVDNLAHEGGGIAVAEFSTAVVRRCVLARNEATAIGPAGGAIIVNFSDAQILSNTIVENRTPLTGASVALLHGHTITGERNIVALATGNGLACGLTTTISCNDVWGSAGTDYVGCSPGPSNLSADPLFCDLATLDLRLDQASPCAPAQSPPGCGLIGALDIGCGPVAIEPATWGRIKAHYAPPTPAP